MKLLQLAIFVFIFPNCFAQKNDSEEQIRAILLRQTECWNSNDLDCFMSYYLKSDSIRFVSKNGVSYSWGALYERYEKFYPTEKEKGILQFTILHIDKLGRKNISVVGKFYLTRPDIGDASGYFTLLFEKIKKEWLIVMDHTSG